MEWRTRYLAKQGPELVEVSCHGHLRGGLPKLRRRQADKKRREYGRERDVLVSSQMQTYRAVARADVHHVV